MKVNKVTLIFLTIVSLILISLYYDKISKKKQNKNSLLITILIFIFILFQLCNPKKVEHFNNHIINLPFIREINLNKSPQSISKTQLPYSNKNEIKILSVDNEYTPAYGLVGTSTELRDIEVTNNTNKLYDDVKDSNLANILMSNYNENSEFIEGSLERDYDFSVEDVNYLATGTADTSVVPQKSVSVKKFDSLPIIYPSKDRGIVVNSIWNDVYKSYFDTEEDTSIIPPSSGTKTSSGSKSKPNIPAEKDVGTAGTIAGTIAGTTAETTAGTTAGTTAETTVGTTAGTTASSQSYKSTFNINDLSPIYKTGDTTTDDTTAATGTSTGTSADSEGLLERIKMVFVSIYVYIKEITLKLYDLVFGTSKGTAPTGTAPTGTAPTGTAPTGTAGTSADSEGLLERIKMVFVSIYVYIKEITLKLYDLVFGTSKGTAPTGTAPTGTAPTGTAPTGTAGTSADSEGLFKHIEDLFESIYKFFKDLIIKIIEFFENLSDNTYNLLVDNY